MSWWLSLYVCVILKFLLRVACLPVPCYRFIFPNVSSSLTINATEDTTLMLPFELDRDECPEGRNQPVHVHVMRPPGENSQRGDLCVVRFEEDTCASINVDICKCNNGTTVAGFVLTKNVTKYDSGTWLWRSGDGFSTKITVNVQENLVQGGTGYNVTAVTIGGREKQRKVSTTGEADSSVNLTTPETVLTGPIKLMDGVIETTDSSTNDTPSETSNTVSIPHQDNTSIDDNNYEHVKTTTTPAITVTGLLFGGVSIAVVMAAFIIVLRRRRRAIKKRRGYCVNVTPVCETNNDVLAMTQSHVITHDAERRDTYVSVDGITMTSTHFAPKAHINAKYLSTEQ